MGVRLKTTKCLSTWSPSKEMAAKLKFVHTRGLIVVTDRTKKKRTERGEEEKEYFLRRF